MRAGSFFLPPEADFFVSGKWGGEMLVRANFLKASEAPIFDKLDSAGHQIIKQSHAPNFDRNFVQKKSGRIFVSD